MLSSVVLPSCFSWNMAFTSALLPGSCPPNWLQGKASTCRSADWGGARNAVGNLGNFNGMPQSRGICISHTAHTLDEIYMDEIHGWNPKSDSMKRLETSGKMTGAGTVQRSLTWSDLMHQTEWLGELSSYNFLSEHDMYWVRTIIILNGKYSIQLLTSIEPIWTLASFAGNVHNQHNLAIVLVQGHILSVDVLHREVVDAVTRHFLRQTPLWWISKWQAVHTSLCYFMLHDSAFMLLSLILAGILSQNWELS